MHRKKLTQDELNHAFFERFNAQLKTSTDQPNVMLEIPIAWMDFFQEQFHQDYFKRQYSMYCRALLRSIGALVKPEVASLAQSLFMIRNVRMVLAFYQFFDGQATTNDPSGELAQQNVLLLSCQFAANVIDKLGEDDITSQAFSRQSAHYIKVSQDLLDSCGAKLLALSKTVDLQLTAQQFGPLVKRYLNTQLQLVRYYYKLQHVYICLGMVTEARHYSFVANERYQQLLNLMKCMAAEESDFFAEFEESQSLRREINAQYCDMPVAMQVDGGEVQQLMVAATARQQLFWQIRNAFFSQDDLLLKLTGICADLILYLKNSEPDPRETLRHDSFFLLKSCEAIVDVEQVKLLKILAVTWLKYSLSADDPYQGSAGLGKVIGEMQVMHDRWAAILDLELSSVKADKRKKSKKKGNGDNRHKRSALTAGTAYPPTLLPRAKTTSPLQPVDALLQQAHQSVQALQTFSNHHQLGEKPLLGNAMDLDSALRVGNDLSKQAYQHPSASRIQKVRAALMIVGNQGSRIQVCDVLKKLTQLLDQWFAFQAFGEKDIEAAVTSRQRSPIISQAIRAQFCQVGKVLVELKETVEFCFDQEIEEDELRAFRTHVLAEYQDYLAQYLELYELLQKRGEIIRQYVTEHKVKMPKQKKESCRITREIKTHADIVKLIHSRVSECLILEKATNLSNLVEYPTLRP